MLYHLHLVKRDSTLLTNVTTTHILGSGVTRDTQPENACQHRDYPCKPGHPINTVASIHQPSLEQIGKMTRRRSSVSLADAASKVAEKMYDFVVPIHRHSRLSIGAVSLAFNARSRASSMCDVDWLHINSSDCLEARIDRKLKAVNLLQKGAGTEHVSRLLCIKTVKEERERRHGCMS